MRRQAPPWLAAALAVVLVVIVSVALLTVAIALLYAGAPPWLVALAVAAVGWGVYTRIQRIRNR